MKAIIFVCLAAVVLPTFASFFSSSKVDKEGDISGCGELLPKSFKMSKLGFTVSAPECDGKTVKAKVSYDPGRFLPSIDIMDASADIELKDNGDSVTIDYENLDLGPINHHIINEVPWLNLTKGTYTFDKFPKGKDTLKAKDKLGPGDKLVSKNRLFQLEYQKDGNLVLKEAAVIDFTVWETKTKDAGKVVLEDNGNLVVYDSHKKEAWESETKDEKVDSMKLQNDGNLVLLSGSDVVWQSGETPSESEGYIESVKKFFKRKTSGDDDDDDEDDDEEGRDDDDDEDEDEDEEEEREKEKKRKKAEKAKKDKKKKAEEKKKAKKAKKDKDAKKKDKKKKSKRDEM